MTDQQSYHDAGGNAHLIVHRDRIEGLIVRSQVDLPDRTPVVVAVPAARLLAMIDTIDPDAMRAYLLETVAEADSPEDVDEPAVIELSDDIDTRLHVIEHLAKILRTGTDAFEVCTLADWMIDR